MLDSKIMLNVKYFSDPTYTDYDKILGDEATGSATITLADSEYLYIGFYKPISEIYFEFTTPNINANTLAAEYYSEDDSDWSSLTITDETNGFTENGFIHFNRPVDSNDSNDWGENTVDSKELYWIRLQPSVTHSETVYKFCGLIFSDDKSLATINPFINDSEMLCGQTTHLKVHVAARNRIIQKLLTEGKIKYNSDGLRTRITGWDILDKNEVKEAAAYLALSFIYFNLSDNPVDSWMEKSKYYDRIYLNLIKSSVLSLDVDDDGLIDDTERVAFSTHTMVR